MTRMLGAPRTHYENGTLKRLREKGELPPELAKLYEPEMTTTPAETSPASSLFDRLVKRFGWGDVRRKREALYRRLVRLVESKGKEAELWIYEAAAKSDGASSPDRYFCAAVVKMLRSAEVHTL